MNLEPAIEIQYQSREEAKVAQVMTRFLDWKPILYKTYQYPISSKHDADFFLPQQNLIVEWHPVIIKFYGAEGVYKRMKRLEHRLSTREFQEVQDILCAQINHEYYKRRRHIMDLSDNEQVRKMRLVVSTDFSGLYRDVIKPYSKEKLTYSKFQDFLEKVK